MWGSSSRRNVRGGTPGIIPGDMRREVEQKMQRAPIIKEPSPMINLTKRSWGIEKEGFSLVAKRSPLGIWKAGGVVLSEVSRDRDLDPETGILLRIGKMARQSAVKTRRASKGG